jgi:hypothetical protein
VVASVKKAREQKRRDNAAYDAAQRALDAHRGGENDEFHRLNDASIAAGKNVSWARRNHWI